MSHDTNLTMPGLLFVPQHPTISGRRKSLYQQEARSHSARVAHRRRKHGQWQSLLATKTNESSFAWRYMPASSGIARSKNGLGRTLIPMHYEANDQALQFPERNQYFSDEAWEGSDRPASTFDRNGAFDRFGSVILDSQSLRLLQVFTITFSPACCQLGSKERPKRERQLATPIVSDLMQVARRNRLCMTTFLASLVSYTENLQCVRVEGTTAAFVGKAYRQMQQIFNKDHVLDQSHVLGLIHLTAAEAHRKNLSGAIIHLRAARRIATCSEA